MSDGPTDDGPTNGVGPTVGFIGLGRMGVRMAANLAESGVPLIVHNRTRSVADEFADRTGATVAETPADLARDADIIITMLAHGPAVMAVYSGPDGVAASLDDSKICIEMSTIGPAGVAELAAQVEPTGAALIDAPVSGSTVAVENRTLMIMAGGPDEAVATARPVLEAISTPVLAVGETGQGATIKLAINSIVYATNQAIAEALVMCERAGLDRSLTYGAFVASAISSGVMRARQEIFERPGEIPVTFTVDLAIKDLQLISGLAESTGTDATQLAANLAAMQEASADGLGDRDMGDVAVHLRQRQAGGATAGSR